MDIVSQTIPWPAGLKEVDAKGTVLLQQAQSWELPGTVPEGIGGTTKAVGDAVRILASLQYAVFKKDSGGVTELSGSFLKFAEAETPKRETPL